MNAIQYVKNVGKSFGYISIDTLKTYNPALTNMAKSAKELSSDLYQSIKDFKYNVSNKTSSDEQSLVGQSKDVIFDFWKNTKEDLMSGNFYNKQRMQQAEDEAMKSFMGGDLNFDFSFDEDFGDFEFEDDEVSADAKVTTDVQVQTTQAMIQSMDNVGSRVAGSITNSVVRSTDYIVSASNRSSKAIYDLTNRGFSNVTTGLAALNANMNVIVSIAEPLNAHMQNSATFYSKSTEFQAKALELLSKIADNTSPKDLKQRSSRTKYTINDLMSDGIIDVKAYSDMVIENVKGYTDMIFGLLDMTGGVKGAASGVTSSPLSKVISAGINKALPKILKESMKNFNGMLEGFFTTFLGTMKDKQLPGILGLIQDMLTPRSSFTNSLRTDNYVKGKVDWDGKSRKALLEVIPTQLAQIVSALTGGPIKIYDYESGRWKTRSDIKKEWKDNELRSARNASGDLYWNANNALRGLQSKGTITEARKEIMSQQIDNYLTTALLSGDSEFLKLFEKDFDYKKFGMDKGTYDFLVKMMQYAKDHKKGKFLMDFPAGIFTGRDNYGDSIRRLNEDGSTQFNMLFNGTDDTEKSRMLLGTDKYNHDVFYYLQGIYLHTKHVSDNLPLLINGSGKKIKGGKITKNNQYHTISDISITVPENEKNNINKKNGKMINNMKAYNDAMPSVFADVFETERITFNNKELQAYYDAKEAFKLNNPNGDWSKSKEYDADQEALLEKQLKAKGFFSGVKDQLSKTEVGKSVSRLLDWISKLVSVPAEKMSSLYDKMSNGLIDAVYGTGKGDGLFDNLKLLFTDPRAFASRMGKKLFGEKGEDGRRHGGSLSGFANSVKDNLWSAADYAANFVGGKANGSRQIRRTGLAVVSEGEMIIPAEYNPYYRGSINKRSQYKNELNIARRFFGGFSDGGQPGESGEFYDPDTKEFVSFTIDENGNKKEVRRKATTEEIKDQEFKMKVNKIKNSSAGKLGAKIIGGVSESANVLYDGIKKVMDILIPSSEQLEKDKKTLQDKMKGIFGEIKETSGAMGAGAIIGGGVSLLTGGLISPILAAGVGAAAGLVIKSQKVQDILFGENEVDKDGNVIGKKGGLLSKNISNFLTKEAPGIAVGGTLGAAGGLFMGSPILGAVVGSTLGYVKSSKRAHDWLFGEEDIDNGVISKDLQKKVKEALPNIGAGALAGLLVGPFGIAGNIIVGSALGYASKSNKFQEWLFGKKGEDGKREGGFVKFLKDAMIDPMVGIFDKLAEELKHTIRDTFHNLGKTITTFLTNRFKRSKIGEKVTSAAKTVGNKAKNFISSRANVLKAANNWLGGRALNRGYMIRDRQSPTGYKSSIGRMDYRDQLGMDNSGLYAGVDSLLSGFNTKEELDDFSELMGTFYDPYKNTNAELRRSRDRMVRTFNNSDKIDKNTANAILSAMRKGDWDTVNQLSAGLDDEDLKKIIDKESTTQQNANSKADRMKGYKAQLERAFGGKLKDKDIKNIQELAINEGKARQFESASDQKQREAIAAIMKVPDLLHDIMGIMLQDEDTVNNLKGKFKSSTVQNMIERATSETGDGAEEGDTKEVNGETRVFTNGKWENKSELDLKNKFMSTLSEHFPKLSAGLSKVSNLFGNLKEKLFGRDEDGKGTGLFTKLFDKFFGDDSLLSKGISKIFGGTKLSEIVKSFSLSGLFSTIIAPALLYGGFSGKFDDVATAAGFGKSNKNSDVYVDETGNTIYKTTVINPATGKEEEAYVDPETGEQVKPEKVSVRSGDTSSFSEKLKYNAARGALTGTSSVASVVLKGSAKSLGKTKVGQKVTRSVTEAIAKNGGSVSQTVIDGILDGFGTFTKALRKVPMLQGAADYIDDACLEIADTVTTKLASGAAKNLGNLLSNAVIWIKVAFIVADFTTGYEDAATTLGVKDPSVGEKIACGLLRAIKNFIPIVGTLIPDDLLVDIFINHIGPFFGINLDEFKARRDEANQEVAAYNAANGTNYDWEQYNKTVRKDYTWTERIGNAGRSIWTDTKNKFNNMKNSIKEKGIGGYLKESIYNTGSAFMSAYQEQGGGLSGMVSGIGNVFGQMLPGVLGEIAKKNEDIKAYALKGELGNLWKVTLSDFSGGEKNGDIETAVPSIFSKIIGQVPLIMTKLISTPIALISKVKNGIANVFSGLIDKVKTGIEVIQNERGIGAEIMLDPDAHWTELFQFPEIPDSPISGFIKAGLVNQRLIGAAGAVVSSVGRKIGKWAAKLLEPVKQSFSDIKTGSDQIQSASLKGDFDGVWNPEITENEENPIGGFAKGVLFIEKLISTPQTAIYWVGNKIFEGVKERIDAAKNDFGTVKEKLSELKDLSSEGNLENTSKIFTTTLKLDDKNPIKNIYNSVFTIGKLFYTIIGLFNTVAEPVKKALDKAGEFLEGGITGVGETVEKVKDKVKDSETYQKASNWWDKTSDKIQGWKQKASTWLSGGSSGFVSQLDPKYSRMSIGGSNVGQLGCGPAAAVMALNQYSGNMKSAVGLANNYQSGSGTDAAFFADYYARNGASARYYDNTSSAGRSNIINSIASGSPVVLMGRDASNRSKTNSPFGPNNHYVVASGFDGSGNLIINDPESKTGRKKYSSRILNNVSLGVGIGGGLSGIIRRLGFSAGGGGLRIDATTRAVWAFFRDKGFTAEATAGIMGNMQQESGIDPTVNQSGGGPAKGIVQWEGSRFTNMKAFAQQRGKDWTDLDSQLEFVYKELKELPKSYWNRANCSGFEEFMNCKDAKNATYIFETAFERAGKPNMEKRYEYAAYYYKAFAGKTFSYDSTVGAVASTGDTTTSTSGTTNGTTSTSSSTGGLTGFFNIINNAFGKLGNIFNGGSDTTNASTANTTTTTESHVYDNPNQYNFNGKSPVEIMKSLEGKLAYDRSGPRDPSKNSADCSSTVRWAIQKAGGPDIGGYTGAQYNSPNLKAIWYNDGKFANTLPANIQPNDLLFYNRGTSYPDGVGHVEMYLGNGQMIGHGGGKNGTTKGPTIKTATTNKLIKVSRIVDDSSAAGSGLIRTNYSGGASNIGVSNNNSNFGMSKSTAALLSVIIDLVKTLVNNTKRVDDIYNVLITIAKSKSGDNEELTKIMEAVNSLKSVDDSGDDVERSLSSLKSIVDNILASA